MSQLTKADLKVGRVYSAKRPAGGEGGLQRGGVVAARGRQGAKAPSMVRGARVVTISPFSGSHP